MRHSNTADKLEQIVVLVSYTLATFNSHLLERSASVIMVIGCMFSLLFFFCVKEREWRTQTQSTFNIGCVLSSFSILFCNLGWTVINGASAHRPLSR